MRELNGNKKNTIKNKAIRTTRIYHMGHSLMDTTMVHLKGALKWNMLMPIRRASCQDGKVMGIDE